MDLHPSADSLTASADTEIARRSISASLGQIALFLIFELSTDFRNVFPNAIRLFAVLIIALNLTRFFFMIRPEKYRALHHETFASVLWLTVTGSAITWAAMISMTIRHFGLESFSTIVAFLIGSGITASSTTSLSPRQAMARTFMTLIIGIPLFALLARPSPRAFDLILIFVTYYVFLWAQLNAQSRIFWDGLRDHYFLREEHDRLQNVLDAIPGLVAWIGPDLTLHGVNKNYAQARGGQAAEFSGKSLSYRNPDTDFLRIVQDFMASASDEAGREVEISMEGKTRWHFLMMRKTHQKPEDRGMEAYLICLDIHDSKLAQAELSEQRAKSEHTAKLAALGEIASTIAHEIRNPLTVIGVSSQLIRKELEESQPQREKLDLLSQRILETGGRIEKIIRGLTRFSRPTEGEPYALVRIGQIVQDSVDLVAHHFYASQVTLRMQNIKAPLLVRCRPVEISQVLVNVLNNALDAASLTREKWVRLEVRREDGKVAISVTDSGSGVSEENLTQIFNPFFTTKPPGKGTGLGLSVSRRILQSHGGTIDLDRRAPNTTFLIRLPLAGRKEKRIRGLSAA